MGILDAYSSGSGGKGSGGQISVSGTGAWAMPVVSQVNFKQGAPKPASSKPVTPWWMEDSQRAQQIGDLWGQIRGIESMYSAYNAPMLASISDMIETARFNNALRQQKYGELENIYREQYRNDSRGVGIDIDINNIQQQYIGVYRDILNEQLRAALGRYKDARSYTSELDRFAGQTRKQDIAAFNLARQEADRNKMLQDRANKVQRAESGATGGHFQFNRDVIAEQHRAEHSKINIEDERSLQALYEALARNRATREQLHWDLTERKLSIKEQQKKLDEREAILKKEAEKLGVSMRALELALQEKLANLGLQRIMSTGQMLDAIAQGRVKTEELLRSTQLGVLDASRSLREALARIAIPK